MENTGRRVGSAYILVERLGRGGMGEVWQADCTDGRSPVAVKLLRPELAGDPEVVARFVQERSILTGVSHRNVVVVRDLVAEGETLAIVMDLVEGGDLRQYLREHKTLGAAKAAQIMCGVCDGLEAVHMAGVVHRDLKPENILLQRADGQIVPRVSDFGISRITFGPSLTRATGLIGTPEYMAPELAEREHASPAADLYSAGVVLYELVCGRTPFAGGHPVAVLRRHLEAQAPRPPGLAEDLWGLLTRMMAKDPADRPGSAGVVSSSLRQMLPELTPFAPLAPQPRPTTWLDSPSQRTSGDLLVHFDDDDPTFAHDQATQIRRSDRPVSTDIGKVESGARKRHVVSELDSEPSASDRRRFLISLGAGGLLGVGLLTGALLRSHVLDNHPRTIVQSSLSAPEPSTTSSTTVASSSAPPVVPVTETTVLVNGTTPTAVVSPTPSSPTKVVTAPINTPQAPAATTPTVQPSSPPPVATTTTVVVDTSWLVQDEYEFFSGANTSAQMSQAQSDELTNLANAWSIDTYAVKVVVGNALLAGAPANANSLASASPGVVQAFGASVINKFFQSSYSYNDAVRLAGVWQLGDDVTGAKYLIGIRLWAGQPVE